MYYTQADVFATTFKYRLQERDKKLVESDRTVPDVWRKAEEVCSRVLSNAEINALLADPNPGLLIKSCGVVIISNRETFFLTDDAHLGFGLLPRAFVAASIPIGMRVKPRPSCEHGYVLSAEDVVAVFAAGEKRINSDAELLTYLNEEA